jgi:hypothetical protein
MPDTFLTASATIARQALVDTDHDPARAAGRWLDLARAPWFRDAILVQFIAAEAAPRSDGEGHDQATPVPHASDVDPSPSAAAGNDHKTIVTQPTNVDPAADPSASERHDQPPPVTQAQHVDRSSADPATGHDPAGPATLAAHVDPVAGPSNSVAARHDQGAYATHSSHVDRSDTGVGGDRRPAVSIREPSPARRLASRRVRRQEMEDMLCIIERNGARTPLKEVPVRRLPALRRHFARQSWANGLQHNLILSLETTTKAMLAHGQIQPDMLVGQIFSDEQLNAEVTAARITSTASTITLPAMIESTERGLWPSLPPAGAS